MLEHEVSIAAHGQVLAGTVCRPDQAARPPVVLMIHGSGPLDRNENAPWMKLNVFNTIAHYLAEHGIASVRYDKRGCGKSTGRFAITGHFDLVADARAWLEYCQAQAGFDTEQIYLLGHSEGTIIAPQVGLQNPRVAGMILLCPFMQNLETLLRAQAVHMQQAIDRLPGCKGFGYRTLAKLSGGVLAGQERLIAKVRNATTPTLRFRLRRIEARWLRELMQIDPPALFRQTHCPLLLIGGAKDVQCDPQDVAEIARLAPGDVTQHVVPDLTHILRLDPEEHTLFRYQALLQQPLTPAVLDLIGPWLARRAPHREA